MLAGKELHKRVSTDIGHDSVNIWLQYGDPEYPENIFICVGQYTGLMKGYVAVKFFDTVEEAKDEYKSLKCGPESGVDYLIENKGYRKISSKSST